MNISSKFFQLIKRKETLLYVVLFIAGLSLLGWFSGKMGLATLSFKYIPIAPASASIFIVLCILSLSDINFEKSRIAKLITLTLILLVSLFSLLIFLNYLFNFTGDIENIFISNPVNFGNVPAGRMSPITSLLFIFICISLLSIKQNSILIKFTGGSFSLLTVLISSVLLIGYLYKAPLLYGSQIIPVSLPAAICFLLFSITLLRVCELQYWTFNLIKKNPTEFLLLKTFLPLVVFVVVLQGFLETNFSINQHNPTLTSALTLLIIVVLTFFIVTRASAILGDKLVRAEKKLRESEEFNRYLLKTIPFGMDIVDENGIVLFQNENLKKHFGVEAIGNKCWMLYRDDKTQCSGCPLKVEINVGTTEVSESAGVLDGKIFEIFHSGIMFDGKKAMLEIFIDITDRKQVEEEIKLKNEELLKINAEKDKFFSIIAHDLKGPFNGFLGLTQLMAEELPRLSAAEVQKIAERMRNSAKNLYHLLENLLDWSQIQKGEFPFNPEIIQIGLVVSSSIEMIHESAKRKNIEISNHATNGLLAFADMNMIQTITRNLVFNAIKFTPKGGKVSILAKATTEKSIEISIQDNGIGMNQNMIENLFRIDIQTNRTGTEGEPSTGLGLLLCKEFTEKNGGKIWVESEEGVGSTFYFTIPIYTPS